MTGEPKIYMMIQAVRYVIKNNIPGDIVECGVWRGGSMMAAALTLKSLGVTDRKLICYDTYEGMAAPTEHDISYKNEDAREQFEQLKTGDDASDWCYCSIEDVKKNLETTGYPPDMIQYVKGKVEDTIPETISEQISLLRLDTDFYESTKHEMEQLYPRLTRGGVIILDDYGYWKGAKKAVDEYLESHDIPLLLNRVDSTGRSGIKLD